MCPQIKHININIFIRQNLNLKCLNKKVNYSAE